MSEDNSQLSTERATDNKVLLHIEDGEDIAKLFKLMAARTGYRVIHKSSVEEAEEFMNTPEGDTITIIVSDFELGANKKDGVQAVPLAQRKNKRLPFILASGATGTALTKYNAKNLEDLGIDGSLPKPFGGDDITQVLSSVENKYGN